MKRGKKKKSVFCKGKVLNHAGTHLLVEIWNAKNISSPKIIKKILKQIVKACGATLLKVQAHIFSPFNGVSGVAILKESHVSIHTWPEFGYAAVDIFVCGKVNPYKALPILKQGFETQDLQILELKRGILDEKRLVL
ncbi:MAG: adenosylmethionine decarboxylase [Candidatus Omnitrophica bacterium]|nr:adenosylmethionine decarboxylase [Candidatus Omnitrophota bacterium]